MSSLQVVWFCLVGVLLTVYAVLDGFDLGVGFWHLWTKRDDDRRTFLNAIGPVWDGNEVWLLTGGGALFAAFPPVYASVFSGFYLAMMLVLLALIARAVSLEFRSQEPGRRWRQSWDTAFGLGSTLAALLFGVALGNILRGVPLDEAGNYRGTFLGLLHPYALVIGLLAVAMVAFHGALWLGLKTGGELARQVARWAAGAGLAYLALFVVAALYTFAAAPHLLANYAAFPLLWLVPAFTLVCLGSAIGYHRRGQPGRAFIASSLAIVGLWGMVGAGLFPRLVPALGRPELSLTAANSSSSELTLTVMLVLAALVLPIVIGYTAWVYRSFWGKVDLADPSNHY